MDLQSQVNVPAVKRFVREVVGCQCGEEVFRQIEVERGSRAVPSCPADYELRLGGRLLIVVTSAGAELLAASRLEQAMREGKHARDAAGFNRFRLVVRAQDADREAPPLLRAFETVQIKDEKTHLHVVPPDQVPEFLSPA